jgi:single-strand DNA-binding protein
MIKLTAIGHLGKDFTVNSVNGKNVINFTVAHSEKYKNNEGVQVDKTTWLDCAYWAERTGIAPYLKKGTLVYIEGQPEVKVYQKQDRSTGASLSVRIHSVQLLGGSDRNTQTQPTESQTPQNSSIPENGWVIDDLPF